MCIPGGEQALGFFDVRCQRQCACGGGGGGVQIPGERAGVWHGAQKPSGGVGYCLGEVKVAAARR